MICLSLNRTYVLPLTLYAFYDIAYDLLHHKDNTQMLGRFNRIDQEAERFGTSSRVYRRTLKRLIEQGLVTKQKNGELVIINREGLKQYLDELES